MNRRMGALGVCLLVAANAIAAELVRISSDAQHDAVYQRAAALISPHMRLLDRAPVMTDGARAELRDGIDYMRAVTQYNPKNWAAFWIEGKAYQALDENREANHAFEAAYRLQPGDPDVAREYAESCLQLGRGDDAVEVTKRAVLLSPKDAGLRANLALAYLIAGRNQDALWEIAEAQRMDPSDKISKHLKTVIDDIVAGRRQQPRTLADLKQ